jgi:hypothetical protein
LKQLAADYKDWLTQHDVDMSALDIANFGYQGLGVRAQRRIHEGEELLSIPESVILSSTKAFEAFPKAASTGMSACDAVTMLLTQERLLVASGRESKYLPYLAILPTSISLPAFWEPNRDPALTVIRHSPTTWSWLEGKMTDYDKQLHVLTTFAMNHIKDLQVKPAGGEPARKPTFGELQGVIRWADAIVRSRSSSAELSPSGQRGGGECALVPLADNLNHRTGGTRTVGRGADKKWTLKAGVGYQSGDQVFASYFNLPKAGADSGQCNQDALWDYGFAENDARYDCLFISVDADADTMAEKPLSPLPSAAAEDADGGATDRGAADARSPDRDPNAELTADEELELRSAAKAEAAAEAEADRVKAADAEAARPNERRALRRFAFEVGRNEYVLRGNRSEVLPPRMLELLRLRAATESEVGELLAMAELAKLAAEEGGAGKGGGGKGRAGDGDVSGGGGWRLSPAGEVRMLKQLGALIAHLQAQFGTEEQEAESALRQAARAAERLQDDIAE